MTLEQFSVQFRFYKINWGFGFFGSVRPTFICWHRRHLSFTRLCRNDVLPCWIGPTNCSRSDSELEVQRYGMKKNTLTVDPIMLQDELWMRQHEKLSPNRQSWVSENRTEETDFWLLNFEVSSVQFLENRCPTFSSSSAHSLGGVIKPTTSEFLPIFTDD